MQRGDTMKNCFTGESYGPGEGVAGKGINSGRRV